MNISRHIAKDMRSALAMVRDLHGPDAAILSNRKVPEGIEITAAVDYDESLLDQETPEPQKFTFPSVEEADIRESRGADQLQPLKTEDTLLPKPRTAQLRSSPANPQASGIESDDLPEMDFKVELSSAVKREFSIDPKSEKYTVSDDRQENPDMEKGPELVWTQDTLLNDMRKEFRSLKSLVETQISGFAWGEESRQSPVRAGVLRKLVALGLTSRVARHIASRITEDQGHRKAWFHALAMFARQVPIAGDTILKTGGIVALVGPAGVGKTTLIAKLAVQYAVRHGRENVALITTDSHRFGAFDQLRNLGSVLKIPVSAVSSGQELEAALDGFLEKPLILIDSAGLSHRDKRLSIALKTIKGSTSMMKAYMVLSATTQADALEQMIKAFKPADPCGCIITKVDESTSLGPVLSAIVEHKLPITYHSAGQKIPDDLKIAQIQDLIGKAVSISKSMRAFERTEDVMMEQMMGGETL